MKCIQAQFDKDNGQITIKEGAEFEDWVKVCQKFNDDVGRVQDVKDLEDYTGLYECFDDKNVRFFYLVKEDTSLFRIRRRRFLDNIGIS